MEIIKEKIQEDNELLNFLYRTILGRMILKMLTCPALSKAAGWYLDSHLSVSLIPGFAKKNNIDLSLYEDERYHCFNDFFIRKIRSELRPVCMDENVLISPCDGLMSAYRITDSTVVPIKQSEYKIVDLVGDQRVADLYKDGICLVFRLCVNHYHRYCYIDTGKKSKNVFIQGQLHTVRPVALNTLPVFTRNSREYTLIKTKKFGTVLQMEVGAMLVGKICNHVGEGMAIRGQEKGYFKYGGSTVVVLLKKGKADLAEEYFDATDEGYEIPVEYGQKLGESIKS